MCKFFCFILLLIERYGCDCCTCGGPRGCCHSCFDEGFNRDAWAEEDAQRGEHLKAGGGKNQNKEGENETSPKRDGVAEQPEPVPVMDMHSERTSVAAVRTDTLKTIHGEQKG